MSPARDPSRSDAQANLNLLMDIWRSSVAVINASELSRATKAKLRIDLEVAYHVMRAVLDRIEKDAPK